MLLSAWWIMTVKWTANTWVKQIDSKWIFAVSMRIFFDGIRFFALWFYAQKIDRALSAYVMEAVVFIWILLIYAYKKLIMRHRLILSMPFLDIKRVFLYSLFVLLWTGGVAYASKVGNISVVAAITSMTPIFNCILWRYHYKEHLHRKHIAYILLSLLWLLLFRI